MAFLLVLTVCRPCLFRREVDAEGSEMDVLEGALPDWPRVHATAVVAEAPWSVAEWAVALRFDNPRATVPVLLLG